MQFTTEFYVSQSFLIKIRIVIDVNMGGKKIHDSVICQKGSIFSQIVC